MLVEGWRPLLPEPIMAIIRGLTLHRPWPFAFLTEPRPDSLNEPIAAKRVENRSWAPPEWMRDQYIALHSGQHWDDEGGGYIETVTGLTLPPSEFHGAGEIFAVAKLSHWVNEEDFDTMQDPAALPEDQRPWFFGPWGWILTEFKAIEPVKCRGFQKLWKLPPLVLMQVRERYREVV